MLPIATTTSIKKAYQEIKHFSPDSWEGDYRDSARQALKEILQGKMQEAVDLHLEQTRAQAIPDRRNGFYSRHLLTELGDIELSIPRTRTYNPVEILGQYARRGASVNRLILMAFVLGVSTRKVGQVLMPVLGEPVSAQTVSRVAR